jgi:AcrR family transcriptional regulator
MARPGCTPRICTACRFTANPAWHEHVALVPNPAFPTMQPWRKEHLHPVRRSATHAWDEATRAYAAQGYVAASLDRVTAGLGKTIGFVRGYFPDKASLIRAVAERHFTRLFAALDRRLRKLRPFSEMRVVHASPLAGGRPGGVL